MRTRKSVQSLRSTNTLRRIPYVCSSCRRNAFRSTSSEAAKYNHGPASALRRPTFAAVVPPGNCVVRWLSRSSRHPNQTDPAPSGIDDNTELPASVYAGETVKAHDTQSVEGALPQGDGHGYPTRQDIRSRLRKWSEEQAQLADASGSLVASINTLPPNNSLLYEEDEMEDDTEAFDMNQDNFDPDDEVTFPHNFLGLEPGDVFQARL
jgi:hypothetical protein